MIQKQSTRKFLVILLALVLLSGCRGGTPVAVAPAAATVVQGTASPTIVPVGIVTQTPVPSATATGTSTPSAIPAPTQVPLPRLSIRPGDFYFSLDGKPTFLLSRNPTGKTRSDFETMLAMAKAGGTRLIRVHLTHGWWGDMGTQKDWRVYNPDWTVNETWARNWERYFDQAQADGISVLPVFGVWADWNRGRPDFGGAQWQYNWLNRAKGGPLAEPETLFVPDSEVQQHWLAWVESLVRRWQGRGNIAGWEIFSEINIAGGPDGYQDARGGVSEAAGEAFFKRAAGVIRAADEQHRPVTLSLAEVYGANEDWAQFYSLEGLDFIQIHMYHDQLDRILVTDVRKHLEKYRKPVMIGESGLWSLNEKLDRPGAQTAIRHALWAGLVSGAMNGRGLWYNDGYVIYNNISQKQAMDTLLLYADLEGPVESFTEGVDFSGFQPLTATSSAGVWGAAVGNQKLVLGWFRDAGCEPPDWKIKEKISGQTITILLPENAGANWKVDFYDTKTGKDPLASTTVTQKGGAIRVMLPDFQDDIAFKAYAGE